ncbi:MULTISPECIES: hypothetical protein [Microbacterium]|uniref:hypothetical protein n=1 Tax=Microbacterium TaxID=33882 RepID=UPI0007342CF1|nr:hypothetical protein [Microbacterium oxydans]KTR78011.1 hypothetical protein NS234_04915 [Microbacterium oxydans]
MGYTLDAYGKPVVSPTPTQTVVDLQAIADFAASFANVRVGTSTERQVLPAAKHRNGMLWVETDTGRIYRSKDAAWVLAAPGTDWVTLTPASGWAVSSGAIRYRLTPGGAEISAFEVTRTGSNLAVNAGAAVVVGVLPAGVRPPGNAPLGSGTIGVGGNLGASRWYVGSDGSIFFQSMVVNGTMTTAGGVANHAFFGTGRFEF